MPAPDGDSLRRVREEVERLKKYQAERDPSRDVELKEAKRLAAEGLAAVEKAKVVWDEKLAAEVREHELSRKDDAERIAR